MKTKYLILLLLNITVVHAQQIHLQGSVVDAQTNQPIAASTISIIEKKLFYPADNAGKFEVISNELTNTDSVGFSCIGYQTQKIKTGDMPRDIVIKLSPMMNMLHEVKIGINAPALIIMGNKAKINDGMGASLPGYEMATYIAGSKNIKGKVKTVGFFLCDGHSVAKGGDATAPFRIKIYGVDTNGKPGKELTQDIIIVSAKKNNAWFDVDMSAYHIKNPDSGFFVAFCVLDERYYKIKKGYQDSHIKIDSNFSTPRMGATEAHGLKQIQYMGEDTMFGWEWNDGFNPGWKQMNYMIRATVEPD
jgi:hypothetical protein